MKILQYHFHLYYEPENINLASDIRDKISNAFEVEVGRLWDRPVGPHPIGSCQIIVPVGLFEKVVAWLLYNRNGVDVLVHPLSGDDIADHNEFVMWIGKPYELNTYFFDKNRSRA